MDKVYELVIPRWNAIGRDYPGLEIRTAEEFETVEREFVIQAGTQLRGNPELLERMLDHGFVREVTS